MTRILPQRITGEHIIGNIDYMRHSGAHIVYRGPSTGSTGHMTLTLFGGSARTAASPAASTGGSTPASSTAFRTALTIDAHGQPCYNRHERRCRP